MRRKRRDSSDDDRSKRRSHHRFHFFPDDFVAPMHSFIAELIFSFLEMRAPGREVEADPPIDLFTGGEETRVSLTENREFLDL